MKNILRIIVISFLLLAATAWATPQQWLNATSLTGGTTSSLDSINGILLQNERKAIVITASGQSYWYNLDSDSALTESAPGVIKPDSNAGDKRWILMWSGGRVIIPDSTIDQGDNTITGTLAWHITNASGDDTTVTVLPGTYKITTSITTPITMSLKFEKGGMFKPDATKKLTVYSPEHIIAGKRQQIIDITNNSTDPLAFTVSGGHTRAEWLGGGHGIDSTLAIQSLVNAVTKVKLHGGKYITTDEIAMVTGSGLIGIGTYSGIATLGVYTDDIYLGTTMISYEGSVDANLAIVRASTEAVGTEPVDIDTRNLQNVTITNLILQGNDKAGYGLYAVRAFKNNILDYITVTGTTVHAFVAMQCFGGTINNWQAFINKGNGLTLGKDIHGDWTAYHIDQTIFNSFYSYYSGHDQNRDPVNQASEASPEQEYGMGIFGARDVTFNNLQSASSGGPNVYIKTYLWSTKIISGYSERGFRSSEGSPEPWGIWVQGVAAGLTRGVTIEDFHLGQSDQIRLTGTEPSRKGEDAIIFRRLPIIAKLEADWGNYRLEDCDSSITIAGTEPYMIRSVLNNQLNLSISGASVFLVVGAAINATQVAEGVVASIAYTGTGDYRVTLSYTMEIAKYGVLVTGDPGLVMGVEDRTTTTFDIRSHNTAGDAADSGLVSFIVFGYFEL